MSIGLKALLVLLAAVAISEGVWIGYMSEHPVRLGRFNFYDQLRDSPEVARTYGDTYVTASGTWIADIDLAYPEQTIQLDCWRQQKQCIEMRAFVIEGRLKVDATYWELAEWGMDEILLKDNETPQCVIERLSIDRKNQVVTRTRVTKKPKPGGCEAIQDEPIVMRLGDGVG